MLMSADVRQVILLGMLDLSAPFDYIDHSILLQRLRIGFGLIDVALQWNRLVLDGTQYGHSKSLTTAYHKEAC